MMTNSYTYVHNGLSPFPSMPVANKTLHAFLVHLTSKAKKMPSPRLSINTNRQNTQCQPYRPPTTKLDPGPTSLRLLGNFANKWNSRTEKLRM